MDIAIKSEARRDFAPIFLFAFTLFSSASLMFVLQPMFGKVLLPLLGGAASVWNTCMVFYQSILFLGYLYAHFLSSRLPVKRQLWIHGGLMLLTLCLLPIGIPENSSPPAEGDPTLWLLGILLMSIGLPFFILSTTSPLLQKWFSRIGHKTSDDPYYLSIASNTGSLLALLGYPFLFEPQFGLGNQQQWWSIGFLLLCGLICFCMGMFRQHGQKKAALVSISPATAPGISLQLKWLLLSLIPSSLLLGTTNYISIDIASMPLLWVIPLAIYLLSFIIVFSNYAGRVHKVMVIAQHLLVIPFLVYFFSGQKLASFSLEQSLHLLVFFVSIMVCHGELARQRPATQYLTQYYLIMSFGGMMGGMFNNFIAPFIFDTLVEYPLMIVAALLLNPSNNSPRFYLQRQASQLIFGGYLLFFAGIFYLNYQRFADEMILGLIVAAVVANLFIFHKNLLYLVLYSGVIVSCTLPATRGQKNETLYQARNFYGILSIEKGLVDANSSTETIHRIYSGSTEHGAQIKADRLQCTPVSYYGEKGPIGQLFQVYAPYNDGWDIGIVGLGSGALGGYAKAGQKWTFYEINPAMVEVAGNPEYFDYLSGCVADYDIAIGDARLVLEKQQSHSMDLLVIDAFTSDSIPMHLMTKEAVELYFNNLNDKGLLAFHVSNHHLDLKKVLADHAEKLGLLALIQEFKPEQKSPYVNRSDWVVLTKGQESIAPLLTSKLGEWKKLESDGEMQSWTDDFTSIVSVWK